MRYTSYKVVSTVDGQSKPAVVYRGPNVVETFLEKLLEEELYIVSILKEIKPMLISSEEEEQFQKATHCHICEEELGADRVRDHDHLTGLFRGAAHNECNINFKFVKENQKKPFSFDIPVIFHNLRGYDSHHIMSAIGKFKHKRLSCIPNNMESYISFSMGNLRFIDSVQFLNSSLEKLVSNLAADGKENFFHLRSDFEHHQGIFPYDYIDSVKKLEETRLPEKKHFYNHLTEQHVTQEDYQHAQEMWTAFNCQNLGDYHDLYMKTDVLLLADIFENFHLLCMETYKLDPAHYYTSLGLSWDAMLKHTKINLQLIDDIDMYLLMESGLRGGISVISNRYAKANNPYLSNYNPDDPTSYIVYLDANNLYGWAMSQYLPEKEFCWMTEEQIATFDPMCVPDTSSTGYILEVDLEYPSDIHDAHNDYPLAPQRLKVDDSMLSLYTKSLKERLNIKGLATEKLIPNLQNKQKYVLHYRNLKLYLELGMKLIKVHRGVEFTQSPWLQSYISLNTDMRKNARNVFEKDSSN